jgi:Spy/CpxP family protein refolding chaperone
MRAWPVMSEEIDMSDGKVFDPGCARRLWRRAVLIACAVLTAAAVAGCGRHQRDVAMTPEEFRERFDRATERALERMDATEEQKARIRPIADDLAAAMYGFREEHKALRDRFVEAFEAERVDPEEVAKIRAEALALTDRATGELAEAIIRASEVLTPEQRRKLAERWKK